MTDFEREDLELSSVMKGRFTDLTKVEKTHKPVETPKVEKTPKKVEETPNWIPTKEHNWMDSLKGCVKWALPFGILNMLIFFWEMKGLMDESIAVPCMWVCCALAGFGVGRNIWREIK